PHPGLTVFDATDGTNACTRRNRSNTPLQALTLLNDQGFMEFAQALAARLLQDANASDSDRIRQAFQLCLARPPSPKEEQRLLELRARQTAALDRSPEEAKQLAPQIDKVELPRAAAWTMVARVLLNLDEFIPRE